MEQAQHVVLAPQFTGHYVRYAKGALLCGAIPSIGRDYESYYAFSFSARSDRARSNATAITEVVAGDRFDVISFNDDDDGRMVLTVRRAVFLELRVSPSVEHRVEVLFYEWDQATSLVTFDESATVIPPRSLTRRITETTDQEHQTVRSSLRDWLVAAGRDELLLGLGAPVINLTTNNGKHQQQQLLHRSKAIVCRRSNNNNNNNNNTNDDINIREQPTLKRGRPMHPLMKNSLGELEKTPTKTSNKKKMKETNPLTDAPMGQACLIFDGRQFSSVNEMTHYYSQELAHLRADLQILNSEKQQWQSNTKLQLEVAYYKGRCEGVSGNKVDMPF